MIRSSMNCRSVVKGVAAGPLLPSVRLHRGQEWQECLRGADGQVCAPISFFELVIQREKVERHFIHVVLANSADTGFIAHRT